MLKNLVYKDLRSMKVICDNAYLWRYLVNKKQFSKFTSIKIVDSTSCNITDRRIAIYPDNKAILVSINELECVIRSAHAFIWSYTDWSDSAIISIFENALIKYYDDRIAEENNKILMLKDKKYSVIESLKITEKYLNGDRETFE